MSNTEIIDLEGNFLAWMEQNFQGSIKEDSKQFRALRLAYMNGSHVTAERIAILPSGNQIAAFKISAATRPFRYEKP